MVERGPPSSGPTPAAAAVGGWFDAVMMRQAVRLNSLSEVALTKLDVLDSFDTVKVCVAYESGGERFIHPPYHQSTFHQVVPVYEELPGGKRTCRGPPSWRTCRRRRASTSPSWPPRSGCPIQAVGVVPGREQFVRFAGEGLPSLRAAEQARAPADAVIVHAG